MTSQPRQPLAGLCVIVTRAREQAGRLSERLRALGAHVIELPVISIAAPDDYGPLDSALQAISSYQWLVLTSTNTVRALATRLQSLGLALDAQRVPNIAVIGPSTAHAAQQAGFSIHLQPDVATAGSLAFALAPHIQGKRILLPTSEIAHDTLPTLLRAAGAEVVTPVAYRNLPSAESTATLQSLFQPSGAIPPAASPQVHALTFTSSSTVTNFFHLLQSAGIAWPAAVKVFSIGPVTSATLHSLGRQPDGEASRHDLDGLVEAVVQGFPPAAR